MNEKTQTRLSIIGLLVCTALYAALIFGKIPVVPGYFTPTGIKIADTTFVPVAKQGLDTIIDVKGKNAFFIGDSHTANY